MIGLIRGWGVQCYCGQDDWADKRMGEEADGVTEWRGHRIVETEQTRKLVKGDCSNLASEDVDEVLDDSAVVAAARRAGAGQDLDQGGGGGGWRGGGGAGGGGGVAPAEQAETEEPALRSCRDDA